VSYRLSARTIIARAIVLHAEKVADGRPLVTEYKMHMARNYAAIGRECKKGRKCSLSCAADARALDGQRRRGAGGAVGACAPDLEALIDSYEVELKEADLIDWHGVLALASEAASAVGDNRPRLIGLSTSTRACTAGRRPKLRCRTISASARLRCTRWY
jgi:hypothetical protein